MVVENVCRFKEGQEDFANLANSSAAIKTKYPGESFELNCQSHMWSEECSGCTETVECVAEIDEESGTYQMVWNVTDEQLVYCRGNLTLYVEHCSLFKLIYYAIVFSFATEFHGCFKSFDH